MKAFLLSLLLTFSSEMGDKSQFMALAFATRYSVRHVMLGILWATAAVHLLSVGLGSLVGAWLPRGYVEALSALCFLGFAIWTLREKREESVAKEAQRHPILVVGITLFLAELGDKTMLTAAALATTHPWFPVWVGTTIGMVASDGVAVWVGRALGKTVPEKVVKWVSAGLFLVFAAWYAFRAVIAFR